MYSHLIRHIEDIPVLVRTEAERLVDQAFDRVLIPALQHDPAIVSRSFYEWRISLADARTAITEHLHYRIRGHLRRDGGERPLAQRALWSRHPAPGSLQEGRTIVDLNMLVDIIAERPDAHINISASKPDPEAQKT